MKVNYVKTIGFRKFENEFETKLYDITSITGQNRSGKSNVLYAIINILLGTNLSGDEKACLINKNCDASYGELHFTDNRGIEHILIRVKNRTNSKKNMLTLDGKNVTQNELTSFYKDKKLFLSIYNPLYFLNKKPAEQKEMVDKYLEDIEPKEIFDELPEEEKQRLIDRHIKDKQSFETLTDKEKRSTINLEMRNIFMDIAFDKLDISEQNKLEGIPRDMPTFISELNADIKNYETQINMIDGKIDYAQDIVNTPLSEYKTFEKEVDLSLARQELAFLSSNQDIVNKEKQKQTVENLEKEILDKETEIVELDKSMQEGKKKYLSIKNGEISNCPTCGQHIENTSKVNTIQNMKITLTKDFERKNLLESQMKDLKSKFVIERCKYHAFDGESTIEKSKKIATIQETIQQLENEKLDIEKYNQEIKTKENLIISTKQNISKLNKDKSEFRKYIDNVTEVKKIAQKLYISYIEEKMKLAKQYLKDVDIQFYSVLKTTGEIKEDFVITYKNHSLSDLSRSETIATALEFANMFNKIAKTKFPIFIDDYESCADYDFIKEYSEDTQILIAKVEKGTNLSVTDYYNETVEMPMAA